MPQFKFITDCTNTVSCKIVQEEMKKAGFENVKPLKGTLKGDHTATKKFSSLKIAKNYAKRFFEKHKKQLQHLSIE